MAAKTTIALVTGANKGIGRAVAIQLAKDHGYTVIIASRQIAAGEAVASELKSQGYQASSLQLDLASDESIINAVKTIDQQYGRLDVLVNNAGVLLDGEGPNRPKVITRELYDRTFTTNVAGPAVLTEALVPLLRKGHGGPRLVFVSTNMSSLANATNKDLIYYNLNSGAYNCSKAAVNMLALDYVRLLEDVSGHVNIVCPGFVKTDLTGNNPYAKTPEEGAEQVVKLATIGEDGPNGTFTSVAEGTIPW
jgi:NAD(P)-dependent dehydrogenase (short-subunit alcohol dehydrogenase family)